MRRDPHAPGTSSTTQIYRSWVLCWINQFPSPLHKNADEPRLFCISRNTSLGLRRRLSRSSPTMVAAVGYEPTPPKRLVTQTRALDRSATLMVAAAVEGTSAPQDGPQRLQLQWHRNMDRPFSVTVRRPLRPSHRLGSWHLWTRHRPAASSSVFSSAPAISSAWRRPTSSAALDYNGACPHRTADQTEPYGITTPRLSERASADQYLWTLKELLVQKKKNENVKNSRKCV